MAIKIIVENTGCELKSCKGAYSQNTGANIAPTPSQIMDGWRSLIEINREAILSAVGFK